MTNIQEWIVADLMQAATQLSPQMHHMRDVLRAYWGPRYGSKVIEWRSAITSVAESRHVPPLHAAIQLAKVADGNDFAVIAAMAAYVEMVEPSDDVKSLGVAA